MVDPAPHPLRPSWETSPRAERVRARLGEAEAHLEAAWERLSARPPDHQAALAEVLASFRASLLAFLNDYGATPDPDAPLDVLAERAVRCGSVLKTVVHRAMLLAERAPAIRQASRLSVADREDVETGGYMARNLVQTVQAGLPAVLRSAAWEAPPTSTPSPQP